jgi:hypothetical protein
MLRYSPPRHLQAKPRRCPGRVVPACGLRAGASGPVRFSLTMPRQVLDLGLGRNRTARSVGQAVFP